jgi:hypothetical protein
VRCQSLCPRVADTAVIVVSQSAERSCAVAGKRWAMHERQLPRCEIRKPANCRAHAGVQTGIFEQVFGGDRGTDDVALRQGRSVAELGEQVAAQQRPGRFFIDDARFPAMGNVRRVEVANPLAVAELDRLAVLQNPRCAVGHVIQRYQTSGLSVGYLGLRRDCQPLVHRATFIGFEVTISNPAQTFRGDNALQRIEVQREHLAQAGVKHDRLVCEHKELIESDTAG